MVEMALSWNDYSLGMLCDLVERLHDMTDTDQARVWGLVERWAKTKATDGDKAAMREKIRVSTLSRRAALRAKQNVNSTGLATAAKAAYAALEPNDILNTLGYSAIRGLRNLPMRPRTSKNSTSTSVTSASTHRERTRCAKSSRSAGSPALWSFANEGTLLGSSAWSRPAPFSRERSFRNWCGSRSRRS
jgi:hypothetical protein